MFRIEDGEDISDSEFEEIVSPFVDFCNDYLLKEVIPQYAALYLAEGYRRSALWECPYENQLNSALDTFNICYKDKDKIKQEVTDILLNKYGLIVISDDPLDFEEVD